MQRTNFPLGINISVYLFFYFKKFFKERINVSEITFKNGSLTLLLPSGQFDPIHIESGQIDPKATGGLRHHFWFLKEPLKPGFFKELFP